MRSGPLLDNLETDDTVDCYWHFTRNGASGDYAMAAIGVATGSTSRTTDAKGVFLDFSHEKSPVIFELASSCDYATVTSGPQSAVVLEGKSVGMGVAAAGTLPFSYQWRIQGGQRPRERHLRPGHRDREPATPVRHFA